MAQRADDAPDPGQRHAVRGFPVGPGRHRAVVGVDAPVGQQVQLRVEQLPVDPLQRQAAPAAVTHDVQHRCGVPHHAYLPDLPDIGHLVPFALRAAFPPSLAGRYSRDYYEASVTIGLAPLR